MTPRPDLNYPAVAQAALSALPAILARWLPDGIVRNNEYVAKNPKRDDRRPGSFSVNLRTGVWADFAVADARGGDAISLAAYLAGIDQATACRRVAAMLGVQAEIQHREAERAG